MEETQKDSGHEWMERRREIHVTEFFSLESEILSFSLNAMESYNYVVI